LDGSRVVGGDFGRYVADRSINRVDVGRVTMRKPGADPARSREHFRAHRQPHGAPGPPDLGRIEQFVAQLWGFQFRNPRLHARQPTAFLRSDGDGFGAR
jgi:hypothetical protein